MFTGIVEETGEVLAVDADADGVRLRYATSFDDLDHGDSICVSGTCLTVEDQGDGWIESFLAEETVARTYLGDLAVGEHVNLERAMPADGRFDGHVVQGHVDGTGDVVDVEAVGEDWRFSFELPDGLGKYVVEKGSITIDGASLTVASKAGGVVEVAVIPETYRLTTLSEKDVGDPVHVEVDVLAKYVEQLLDGYR